MVKSTGEVAPEPAATSACAMPASATGVSRLSMERLFWLGLLLVAAALRLWDLGGQPLSSAEAANALSSWQMVRAQGGAAAEPLLIYWNALAFFAFGANDAVSRLLPALAGVVVVSLPYFLRLQLGRWGALAAGTLLALSANLIYYSRLAQSQSLCAAAGLAAAVFLIRFQQSQDKRWLSAAAIALGVLLLSGSDGFTAVLVFAGAALWIAVHTGFSRFQRDDLRRPALLYAAIALLGATGLLLNLHGLQEGLIDPFGRWLASLGGIGRYWQSPLQVLLVYEPAILLFGVLAAIAAVARRTSPNVPRRAGAYACVPPAAPRPRPSDSSETAGGLYHASRGGSDSLRRFFVWWVVVALLLASATGERGAGAIALAIIPLALLAGPLVARVVSAAWRSVSRLDLAMYWGVCVTLLGLFWIATLFFTMPEQSLPASVPVGPFIVPLRSASASLLQAQIVFMIAALVGFTAWLAPRYWSQLLGMLAAFVLVAAGVHAALLLAYAANASPSELVVSSRTSSDVRVLSRDLGSALDAMAINSQPRAVRVDAAGDVLMRWYLREIPSVTYGASQSPNQTVVVKDVGAAPPAGRFGAQRYCLQSEWAGDQFGFRASWRWLLLRETPAPLHNQDVVLYIQLR